MFYPKVNQSSNFAFLPLFSTKSTLPVVYHMFLDENTQSDVLTVHNIPVHLVFVVGVGRGWNVFIPERRASRTA